MYETHTFDSNLGEHSEVIHVNVTHLVLIPIDREDAEDPNFPFCAIRAFSAADAQDIVSAHGRGRTDLQVWPATQAAHSPLRLYRRWRKCPPN